jgi:hypothetical protein
MWRRSGDARRGRFLLQSGDCENCNYVLGCMEQQGSTDCLSYRRRRMLYKATAMRPRRRLMPVAPSRHAARTHGRHRRREPERERKRDDEGRQNWDCSS